jgi:hypothetical protein
MIVRRLWCSSLALILIVLSLSGRDYNYPPPSLVSCTSISACLAYSLHTCAESLRSRHPQSLLIQSIKFLGSHREDPINGAPLPHLDAGECTSVSILRRSDRRTDGKYQNGSIASFVVVMIEILKR